MQGWKVIGTGVALWSLAGLGAADVDNAIRAQLEGARPDLSVASVEESELPGLYAVRFEDGPLVYATADGRYFVVGDAYAAEPGVGFVNLRERAQEGPRAEAMAAIDPASTIRFAPEGEVLAVVHVFTDVDCGYCQLLHREMSELNGLGIEVRYLAYPRAGEGSETYRKMASAWCARDPQTAMDRLKARQSIPENVCGDNPVVEQYRLGQRLGVQGTPAIVAESGRVIPGYMPAARLARALGLDAPEAAAR